MAEHITLVGAEDVLRASHNMRAAADRMAQAAAEITAAVEQLQRDLEQDRVMRTARE